MYTVSFGWFAALIPYRHFRFCAKAPGVSTPPSLWIWFLPHWACGRLFWLTAATRSESTSLSSFGACSLESLRQSFGHVTLPCSPPSCLSFTPCHTCLYLQTRTPLCETSAISPFFLFLSGRRKARQRSRVVRPFNHLSSSTTNNRRPKNSHQKNPTISTCAASRCLHQRRHSAEKQPDRR